MNPNFADRRARLDRRPLPHGERLWFLALGDVTAIAWMVGMGSWFDRASRFTAVVTLGGHHRLVLLLALAGIVLLAGLAVSTQGFSQVCGLEVGLLCVAAVLTVTALAGVLSVVALIVGAGFFVGLVGRLLLH